MFKQLILAIVFIVFSGVAQAHPHVWIYTDVILEAKEARIPTLKVSWAFDEMYSTAFVLDADKNRDGVMDDKEMNAIVSGVFGAESELHQFMFFESGGERVSVKGFKDVSVTYKDDVLTYTFEILLEGALDLTEKPRFAFFDPEFYVSFEQHPDVALAGASGCEALLEEAEDVVIYNGLMTPEIYRFSCSN